MRVWKSQDGVANPSLPIAGARNVDRAREWRSRLGIVVAGRSIGTKDGGRDQWIGVDPQPA